MTLDGTPYYLANGSACMGRNVDRLFWVGSDWWTIANAWERFCAERGTGDDSTYKPGIAFEFNSPKVITKVV